MAKKVNRLAMSRHYPMTIRPLYISVTVTTLSSLEPIECFHMTSRRPHWCPKTKKRRPCWCPKLVLWELNSFLMQTLSFVPINLHRYWPREWKHSIVILLLLLRLLFTTFRAKSLLHIGPSLHLGPKRITLKTFITFRVICYIWGLTWSTTRTAT